MGMSGLVGHRLVRTGEWGMLLKVDPVRNQAHVFTLTSFVCQGYYPITNELTYNIYDTVQSVLPVIYCFILYTLPHTSILSWEIFNNRR